MRPQDRTLCLAADCHRFRKLLRLPELLHECLQVAGGHACQLRGRGVGLQCRIGAVALRGDAVKRDRIFPRCQPPVIFIRRHRFNADIIAENILPLLADCQ